jgi:hypothetical protein
MTKNRSPYEMLDMTDREALASMLRDLGLEEKPRDMPGPDEPHVLLKAQPAESTLNGERSPEHGLFDVGTVCITPGALESVSRLEALIALARHATGDWGDCGAEDWQENELSVNEQLRLFSVYHTPDGTKYWIITEADRFTTTILLPDEY